MSVREQIIIGTRGSKLALIQTEMAAQALKSAEPGLEVEIKIITPKGDRDKSTPIPLDTIGKGWFSQEIEQELLDGTIDIAVHSLKDMQTELPRGLVIGAYLPRGDARDVLLTKDGRPLEDLRPGAIVGTDSTRRQVQMLALRPDVVMKSLRANVPNRVQKLYDEDYDAVILAAAGLIRLGLEDKITRYFEPTEMTPAPGQGTIAIETRANDAYLQKLLTVINDIGAERSADIERSFSNVMGGGCKSPTGAYAAYHDGTWTLISMTTTDNGTIIRDSLSAPREASGKLGVDLAQKMLDARKHDTNS